MGEFDSYLSVIWIAALIVAAGLGLIPANIAKQKGYSFGRWWFYGWMLFIIAFIHSLFLPDKNGPAVATHAATASVADEIKKYNALVEEGVITPEEFAAKKAQLLKQL